jgi:ApbE family protein
MQEPSRIELARRRLSIARRAIGIAAAAGFVVFALAARSSHPGSHANASSTSSVTPGETESESDDSSGFDFGRASIAPSTGGASSLQSGWSLPADGWPPAPARVPDLESLALPGRILLRTTPLVLDLNGVVKGRPVDDALALQGGGWVSAGDDVATTVPVNIALPAGGSILLQAGRLATSSVAVRRWLRGGQPQHHLIDPATGRPARTPWRDVTVAAQNCVAADVAAKAALILGGSGPAWLDRLSLPGRFVDGRGAVHVNDAWQRAVPSRRAA